MTKGLNYLCVEAELDEIKPVLASKTVKLKRTFNQSDFKGGHIKYWRVMGPVNHPSYHSDLSVEGLKEWGIIR